MNKKRSEIGDTTLEQYIKVYGNGNRFFNALKNVYKDIKSGKLVLVDPTPPKDFIEYLMRADYCMWLWSVYFLAIATLLSVIITSIAPWITYIRYILGSLYVLFLPGYITIETLYPREYDLSPLERLALSIGLSLAIVPLLGLALNYTPWGIRLQPILAVLSIYIISMGLVAAYRKYSALRKAFISSQIV